MSVNGRGRRSSLRREEAFAFELLRRTLGAEVTPHDDGSLPKMVDGLFELVDGTLGAVEVTTVGDPRALEHERILQRTIDVATLTWAWHVWVPASVRVRGLEDLLVPLLVECEAQRVMDPDLLLPVQALTENYEWFTEHGIHCSGYPSSSHRGRVYLVSGTGGGDAIPGGLDGFPEWLARQLSTDRFSGERAKLADTGRPERHLFLRVHDTWLPFGFAMHVGWETTLPAEPAALPSEITAVWLATQWRNSILWWSNSRNRWDRAHAD